MRSFEQTKKSSECASFVKAIASIEDPVEIRKILNHLDAKAICADPLPECRAPMVGLEVESVSPAPSSFVQLS